MLDPLKDLSWQLEMLLGMPLAMARQRLALTLAMARHRLASAASCFAPEKMQLAPNTVLTQLTDILQKPQRDLEEQICHDHLLAAWRMWTRLRQLQQRA
jgi:hypothetical protein